MFSCYKTPIQSETPSYCKILPNSTADVNIQNGCLVQIQQKRAKLTLNDIEEKKLTVLTSHLSQAKRTGLKKDFNMNVESWDGYLLQTNKPDGFSDREN